MTKIKLNIIYAPQTEPPFVAFENEKGEVWRSSCKIPQAHNIYMGSYSVSEPNQEDSIIVIEPYCVLEKDYRPDFLNQFRYVFSWATAALTDPKITSKIIEINHPSCMAESYKDLKNIFNSWPHWVDRKNEIVFVANNKRSGHISELYSFRVQLADLLHRHSKYKISWYGQLPLRRSYYKGKIESKLDILKSVKFSVCTENSYHPSYSTNYFSEKMLDVLSVGTVPIYMGCFNIDSIIPSSCYLDLRKYAFGEKIKINHLVSDIENYHENNYINFQNKIKNIIENNNLFYKFSYERMYDTMINTFV